MNILYITGCDAPFFNSLLICLQSFAERMPGHRLFVCDFGLTGAQAEFLRGLGVLLARPPALASRGVFFCKSGLVQYLRHNGHKVEDHDAVIWLDADITLMDVRSADFEAVIADLINARADVAACLEPVGRDVGQVIAQFPDASAIAPFDRMVADTGIDRGAPYLCTGLIFFRSAAVLGRWADMAHEVADHPLFDQNVFNLVVHQDRVPFLALACTDWQAYGDALDRVRLVPSGPGRRTAARLGEHNIKLLHTTSSVPGHLLITTCRMTVRDLDLTGPFKLFLAEPLRQHQLQLLALFVAVHGEALFRLGLCARAARPVEGFHFVTL
jgi:hypothetical protein